MKSSLMLLHVTGPACSGKSWLIGKLLDMWSGCAAWDVQDVVRSAGLPVDGRAQWRRRERVVGASLRAFLTRPAAGHIVESSGRNRIVNAVLASRLHQVVRLSAPDDETLRERATARGDDWQRLAEYNAELVAKYGSADEVTADAALRLLSDA